MMPSNDHEMGLLQTPASRPRILTLIVGWLGGDHCYRWAEAGLKIGWAHIAPQNAQIQYID